MTTVAKASWTPGRSDRRGFALAVVVLLLFAVGMAGAVGYRVVQSEARVALQGQEAARAFSVADGALRRYVGTQRGALTDSVAFAIGGGAALVTVRELFVSPFPDRLYLVTSRGEFADPRYPDAPAVRTIRQLASYRRAPVRVTGALQAIATGVTLNGFGVEGDDRASGGECADAGLYDVAGVVGGTVTTLGGGVSGNPATLGLGSAAAVADAVDVPWSTLIDPGFSVDYDGVASWPSFAAIHPDTFPVIRVSGTFDADAGRSGRGTLIVNGRIQFSDGFEWDGIVLAGEMTSTTFDQDFEVDGTFVGGLTTPSVSVTFSSGGEFRFHSCNVVAAGARLAHLKLLDDGWWESMY